MLTILGSIASFLAGLISFAQSLVAEHDKEQEQELGQLREQAVEQAQKAHDEAIARTVDALPVPSDKHRILDGM